MPPTPTNNSGENRFTKNSRLLKSVDFRKVYDNGSRFSCPYFVAFLFRHSSGSTLEAARKGPRVGFTIPRAVGKAVIRNRIRRRIREQLRTRLRQIDPALDIVLNPRRAAAEAPLPELQRQLERLIERCRA